MLKVIIADDEERVCKLIQMLVDWGALGMEVAGAASNGLEALELLERLKPDILITDIRMPGCDGLELIERAKAASPNLEIALISGYAQFEYAQTAIQYDVGGYILKPINKAVLTETLEKLGAKCRERAASATAAEKMQQDSQKGAEILRGRFIEDLLQRRVESPSCETLEREYGFGARGGRLMAVIIKIDCPYEIFNSRSIDVIMKTAEEAFVSAVSAYCGEYMFKFFQSAGYGILSYQAGGRAPIRRALRECLNGLEARLFGSVELTFAVGKEAARAEELPDSFRDAQTAIAERLTEGTGRMYESAAWRAVDGAAGLINESAVAADGRAADRLLEKYGRAAARAVETLSLDESDAAVDELYESVLKLDNLRGAMVLETALAAGGMFIMRICKDGGVDLRAEFEGRCALCGSATGLFGALREFQRRRLAETREKLENDAIRPIRSAKEYVMKHYGEQISLEGVCAAIGFSVSYFSSLFKKETGEGFSKYLARVRIEQARELLRDTDLPVSEICARVGYNDVKHFTATFRKITDLNPSQFRRLYG